MTELTGGLIRQNEVKPEADISLVDTLRATFETESSIAQIGTLAGDLYTPLKVDEGFDPFEQPEFKGLEAYADSFSYVRNKEHFDRVVQKVNRELEYRKTYADAPLWQNITAELAVGISDPVNWIPLGEAGKGLYTISRLGRAKDLAKRTAVAAGASTVVGEALNQSAQETRSALESAANIAGATLLGGVLGGGIGYAARRRLPVNDLAPKIEEELDAIESFKTEGIRSMGAAQSKSSTLDDETLLPSLGVAKYSGAESKIGAVVRDPLTFLMQSPSLEARLAVQELAEVAGKTVGNTKGKASPIAVESLIKQHEKPLVDSMRFTDNAFVKYRLGREKRLGDITRLGIRDTFSKPTDLTYLEFREEVGKALRRGDKHNIPEVQEAAQAWRKQVLDPLKDRAIEAGLLPEDVAVDEALSYFTRVYDRERIKADRAGFEEKHVEYFREKRDNAGKYAEGVEGHLSKAQTAVEQDSAKLEKIDAELATAKPELKKLTDKSKRRVGRLKVERARLKDAERNLKDATKRKDERAVADPKTLKYALGLLRGKGVTKEPPSLSSFIRSQGGIKRGDGLDQFAEIRAFADDKTLGLLSKKGIDIDEMALRATEQGYFSERPSVRDFLDALDEDIRGLKVYSAADADAVAKWQDEQEYIAGWEQALDELGVSANSHTDAQIAKAIAAAEGKSLKLKTGENVGRFKEATFFERLNERRLAQVDKKITKIDSELDEIEFNRSTLKDKVDGMESERAKVKRHIDATNKRIERMQRMLEENRVFVSLSDSELRELASQVTDNILSGSLARTAVDIPPAVRGPLKERTNHVRDEAIEPWLESDVFHVMSRYVKTMASDVELTTKFGKSDLSDQIARINDDYASIREKAKAKGAKPKEMRQIENRRLEDIRHLEAVRDRLRGLYALPSDPDALLTRTGRAVKTFNYLRLLGGAVISSFTDTAAGVMTHGFQRILGSAFNKLIRRSIIARRSIDDIEAAGTAMDSYLNRRAMAMAEINDPYSRMSKVERALQAGGNHFGVITGLAPWTDFMKHIVGNASITRSMQAIEQMVVGTLSKKEASRLAKYGIDRGSAARIHAMFKKHGTKDGSEYFLNTRAWEDREAAQKMLASLSKEVDRTVTTPGQEKPLWMSTELGGVLGQFKSFSFAATQRLLMAGLQERDREFMEGVIASVMMGMFVYYLKTPADKLSDDPSVWVREGIDRSGLMGSLMEANNIVEKWTANRLGLSAALGGEPLSRYQSRGAIGALLGPSFGLAEDMAQVLNGAFTGNTTDGDIGRIRRMIPLQNLFYLRWAFDEIEEGLKGGSQ